MTKNEEELCTIVMGEFSPEIIPLLKSEEWNELFSFQQKIDLCLSLQQLKVLKEIKELARIVLKKIT